MSKDNLHIERDVYFCCTYIPPITSTRHILNDIDLYDTLYNDVLTYTELGYCIIYGDMNSRCGQLSDNVPYMYIDSDIDNTFMPDYLRSTRSNDCIINPRTSQDKVVNQYGKRLIELCIANDILIANGRSVSDPVGAFTCYTHNGSSVVDYMLCSADIIDLVDMKVDVINPLSDHCIIHTFIRVPFTNMQTTENNTRSTTDIDATINIHTYTPYRWKHNFKDKYKLNIHEQQDNLMLLYETINPDEPEHIPSRIVSNSIVHLTDTLLEASKACIKQHTRTDTKHTVSNDMPWHDRECKQLRHSFVIARNEMKKNKTPQTLQDTQTARTTYNTCCRIKKATHDRKITESYIQLKYDNPRKFWSTIKPHKPYEYPIHIHAFFQYFSQLSTFREDVCTEPHTCTLKLNNPYTIDELDKVISVSEVEYSVSLLKCNKSPGQDNLLNECIIYGSQLVIHIITRLFNLLYDMSMFPEEWSNGMIIPIYKKGNPELPSNYRPITLLSSLSKLFTAILCKRLTQWATDRKIFTEAQFGFRPTYSTTDASFTLNLFISKIKRKQKLYCAFVDFSTAFDSVNRELLYSRLTECGVSKKILLMITALYSSVTSCVKLSNTYSDSFTCDTGLRQGDSLSPILFSFYINDLPSKLSSAKDQMSNDILLYADDLAILAESKISLQKKLDLLYDYCKVQQLTVNISKSKIIVFNATKKSEPILYNDCILEEVDDFKYLGITLNRKGNMRYSQQILIKQAIRARATLDNYLRKHKHMSIKIIFELFDTLITPIILYNCELWGITIVKEIEQFHLAFMKRILGVKPSTNTCLVYAELGRYPLYVTIYKRLIKYWLKLTVTEEHKYIRIMYVDSPSPWSLFVRNLLFENGFGYVWEAAGVGVNHSVFIKQFEHRLKDTFQQGCFADISNSHRCNLYNMLNRDFIAATYLHKVNIQYNRKAMTQLRLSSHKLMIERGRWHKIPQTDRLCTECHTLEDEYHVLFICPRYDCIRKQYVKQYYITRPSMHKFIELLNTNNVSELRKLAIFIKQIFNHYSQFVFNV